MTLDKSLIIPVEFAVTFAVRNIWLDFQLILRKFLLNYRSKVSIIYVFEFLTENY